MNPRTSRLIIDFFVRTLDDDEVLDRIIARLPTPEDDFKLKKGLLLRRIQTELNRAPVSEKLMELMELACELDFFEGRAASKIMKKAYCAVIVDCTVRFLEDFGSNEKYIETMKRLWRDRVQEIVLSGNTELISEKLWSLKEVLEAVVYDVVLRGKILEMNTRFKAVKAVKRYLAEAWDELGPSDLQTSAADLIKNGEIVEEGAQDSITMEGLSMPQDSVFSSNEPVINGYGDTTSPGSVHKMSVDEPGEQQVFEGVDNAVLTNAGMDVDGENCRGKASIENEISAEQTRGTGAIPISPMITVDDLAGKGNGSLVRSGRDQSLRLHEIPPVVRRLEFLGEASPGACSWTTKRWWTPLEEEALRSCVIKFGHGNWKQILDAYPDEFQGRTEAALKFKWRRMMPKRRRR